MRGVSANAPIDITFRNVEVRGVYADPESDSFSRLQVKNTYFQAS